MTDERLTTPLMDLATAGEQVGATNSALPQVAGEGEEAKAVEAEAAEDAWLEANDYEGDAKQAGTEAAHEEPAKVDEPSEVAAPATDTTVPELEDSLQVLQRDGWDLKDLAGMPDDVIHSMAAKRQEAQKYTDTLTVERNELLKPVAEHLALDSEGAEVLARFHESLITDMAKRQAPEVTSQLQQQVLGLQVDLARRDLGERFPQLSDAKSMQPVLDKMDDLDATKYSSITELMEAAASNVFADDVQAQARTATDTIRSLRLNGAASPPAATPTESRGLSVDDAESQALDLIEQGRFAEARSLRGQIGR